MESGSMVVANGGAQAGRVQQASARAVYAPRNPPCPIGGYHSGKSRSLVGGKSAVEERTAGGCAHERRNAGAPPSRRNDLAPRARRPAVPGVVKRSLARGFSGRCSTFPLACDLAQPGPLVAALAVPTPGRGAGQRSATTPVNLPEVVHRVRTAGAREESSPRPPWVMASLSPRCGCGKPRAIRPRGSGHIRGLVHPVGRRGGVCWALRRPKLISAVTGAEDPVATRLPRRERPTPACCRNQSQDPGRSIGHRQEAPSLRRLVEVGDHGGAAGTGICRPKWRGC